MATALLALLAAIQLLAGRGPDPSSYGLGYAAASGGDFVRREMGSPSFTSANLCDKLADRALQDGHRVTVVRNDVVTGCEHAVADAME